MQHWPTILRWMWIVAAIIIGIYVGGTVAVRPILPKGWLNPGIVWTPICAIFALLLLIRSRMAWTAGIAMLTAGVVGIVIFDVAYDKLGWRTVGLCAGLLFSVYSIWSLKEYDEGGEIP